MFITDFYQEKHPSLSPHILSRQCNPRAARMREEKNAVKQERKRINTKWDITNLATILLKKKTTPKHAQSCWQSCVETQHLRPML